MAQGCHVRGVWGRSNFTTWHVPTHNAALASYVSKHVPCGEDASTLCHARDKFFLHIALKNWEEPWYEATCTIRYSRLLLHSGLKHFP